MNVKMLVWFACLAAVPMSRADLSDGLVTWFDFGAASTSSARVENLADADHPLSLVSDATVEEDATIGRRVLSFPGNLDQRATFVTPAMTNRTVSFWFERGLTDGPYVEEQGVSVPYLMSNWAAMRLHTARGGVGLSMIGNDNKPVCSFNSLCYRKVWTHYTFTFEETSAEGGNSTIDWKLYIDGMLKESGTVTMTGLQRTEKTTTTWLGNLTDGKRPTMFKLGEFRAWTRALSADEAAEEYARVSTDYAGSLVAAWGMDSIVSSTVADASGRGETLSLGSAVTVTNSAVEGNSCLFVNDGTAGQSWARAQLNATLSDVTYAMWINPSAVSSASAPRIIDGAGGYVHAGSGVEDFSLTVRVGGAETSDAFTFSGATEPWCATKGVWTHLAIVRKVVRQSDGSYAATIRMYANGVKMGERTGIPISSPFHSTGGKIYFFSNGGTTYARPIDACGDEIKVYKGALSEERIKKIYAGAACVRAGSDFKTAASTAVLHGRVGACAGSMDRRGYDGVVAWSLVSAPAGGEGAVIARADNAETEVTLPVAGEYRFRLSAAVDGFTRTSDVTVTRVAAAEGTVPVLTASAQAAVTLPLKGWLRATCSDDAANTWWSKVSGPGGVWFETRTNGSGRVSFSAAGTYVLRFSAENAAGKSSADVTVEVAAASTDAVDLSQNLERHWGFNTNRIYYESVKGVSYDKTFDNVTAAFDAGVRGFGLRVLGEYARLAETYAAARWWMKTSNNMITEPSYMTLSLWFKYEPETDPNNASIPFLFRIHQSLMLRLGIADGSTSVGVTDSGKAGLTLAQQGSSGTTAGMTCDFEGLPSITGRWVHVAAVCPLVGGEFENFEIWVDGVRRTLTKHPSSSTAFPRPARYVNSQPMEIGGAGTAATLYNYGLFSHAVVDKDAGTYRSATFPGVVDEIRLYTRKLNAAEIRELALEPVADANLGPAIDSPAQATVKVRAHTSVDLALGAYPSAGRTLACEWEVASGDATRVEIDDATASSTSVMFKKAGEYVLRLRASDGERSSVSAPVTYVVEPDGLLLFVR